MEVVKNTKIWAIVCPHFGAKACNLSVFEEHRKQALKEKWKVILLGDLVNNGVSAGSKHVGLEWQDSMDPMAQVEKATDVLMPLAKAGLIKVIVGGNHAMRTTKACGLHPEKIIAMFLSIATDGEKPESVMPAILQRIHELDYLGKAAEIGGGRQYNAFAQAREKLFQEIRKIAPGVEERWAVPFQPGIASMKIEGIPTAMHHGTHSASKDNWKSLWQAIPGHRLYFTGHNHSLDHSRRRCRIGGKKHRCDFYSCGTYQGYEEYASIACYTETEVGSILVDYNHSTDRATHVILD